LVIRDDVPAEPPEEEEKPYVGLHTPDSDAVATPTEYDVTDFFTARPRQI
jgi:hypothetical protein